MFGASKNCDIWTTVNGILPCYWNTVSAVSPLFIQGAGGGIFCFRRTFCRLTAVLPRTPLSKVE